MKPRLEEKRQVQNVMKTSFTVVLPTSLTMAINEIADNRMDYSKKKVSRQEIILEAVEDFVNKQKGIKSVIEHLEEIKNEIRDLKTNVAQ